MYGVEALPLIQTYARGLTPDERMVFVRVYLDMFAECARRHEPVPHDWDEALQTCLAAADAPERAIYSDALSQAYAPARRESPRDFSFATRDDVDTVANRGDLDELLALAGDSRARLRPEHFDLLVLRARALAAQADIRLARALLQRRPLPVQAAPLFLLADNEQRAAILLAAQRAELGRDSLGVAPKLAEEMASRLEFAAVAGRASEFAAAFGEAMGLNEATAAAIAADPTGEPLALALIALGAPRDLAVRVMTGRDISEGRNLSEGETFPRIHTLSRLIDRVSFAAARRIVLAIVEPAAQASAPKLPAAPRAAQPSPFARRESQVRATRSIPETSARSALNSRSP